MIAAALDSRFVPPEYIVDWDFPDFDGEETEPRSRTGVVAGAFALLGLMIALTAFIIATAAAPHPGPAPRVVPIINHKSADVKEYTPSPDCCETGVFET